MMSRKLIFLAGLFIVLVIVGIFVVRFGLGGAEDSWICENGQWLKHGYPSAPMPETGCGQPKTNIRPSNEPDNNQVSPAATLANPASVYCREQGGELKIVEGEGGQAGICVLKDGRECNEWAYFRHECP